MSLHGSVHWPLGRLVALLGRTEQALDHFASALAVSTRLGARPFVVVTRLDWAATLAERAAGDDLAQARELARQAASEARRLDMPGPAGRAERLARELEQVIAAANPQRPPLPGLISFEGTFSASPAFPRPAKETCQQANLSLPGSPDGSPGPLPTHLRSG